MEKAALTVATVQTQLQNGEITNFTASAEASRQTAYPPHIDTFLDAMKAKFATAKDDAPWDNHDRRDYGRAVMGLTSSECREVLSTLRQRYRFRPAVALVVEVVAELRAAREKLKPAPETPLTLAEYRRRAGQKVLPGTGESSNREAARAAIAALAGRGTCVPRSVPNPRLQRRKPEPIILPGVIAVAPNGVAIVADEGALATAGSVENPEVQRKRRLAETIREQLRQQELGREREAAAQQARPARELQETMATR